MWKWQKPNNTYHIFLAVSGVLNTETGRTYMGGNIISARALDVAEKEVLCPRKPVDAILLNNLLTFQEKTKGKIVLTERFVSNNGFVEVKDTLFSLSLVERVKKIEEYVKKNRIKRFCIIDYDLYSSRFDLDFSFSPLFFIPVTYPGVVHYPSVFTDNGTPVCNYKINETTRRDEQ